MTGTEAREQIVAALRLDLEGPGRGLGDANEVLERSPSRWYLTGFLAPSGTVAEPGGIEEEDAEIEVGEPGGDDDTAVEPEPARVKFLPSSLGLSVLLPPGDGPVEATVRWGDYKLDGKLWPRQPRSVRCAIALTALGEEPSTQALKGSHGLQLVATLRAVPADLIALSDGALPAGCRVLSVFVVNQRKEASEADRRDEAFAFQCELELAHGAGFLRRPDLRGGRSRDWDDLVADVQYRDAGEWAVGHNVASAAVCANGACHTVRTAWIPEAAVPMTAPSAVAGVELGMEALGALPDAASAQAALGALPVAYRAWIAQQRASCAGLHGQRRQTAEELASRAEAAAGRIERGVAALADPVCLEAFRAANRAMAAAARKRAPNIDPRWRVFQLAFILLNLPGIADAASPDRQVVDLLFFPTGGGKTEAYLGLAAFTLVLRRLQHPGIGAAGVAVLMRYTLRLLTLDQLGRAAALICALELERRGNPAALGEWPFEIGLWVGLAATPNVMGQIGDNKPDSARLRTRHYANGSSRNPPIPLAHCPWCQTPLSPNSFRLLPSPDRPTALLTRCVNPACEFSRERALPILAVDEQIYRRLPCFIIATVDKFASLPWNGRTGTLFGRVERADKSGFYGPCDAGAGARLPEGRLPPPALIIQDELHLISGPLGTMAGLYETALDALMTTGGDCPIRPKVVASTATVRRAEPHVRALFGRAGVEIFPPPGVDRHDAFFAHTVAADEAAPRLYVGVSAQGRSPKVALLRVYLALLGAAQKLYAQAPRTPDNPADAYMTLVGYFNSLRELGGARRIIEGEIQNRLRSFGAHRRHGEATGSFADREIGMEPVELTSREDTAKVAADKERLAAYFCEARKKPVDVAIATNMFSVGLDIPRLGLMAVFGQPKATAEYIQATSRVGRDANRPGLVVTICNVHRPRDRSHFERFAAYHESFYRSVEASSVTPFSPRALDRGLAGMLVGLARQATAAATPPAAADRILDHRAPFDAAARAVSARAAAHARMSPPEQQALQAQVEARAMALLDLWASQAAEGREAGAGLSYNRRERGAGANALLHDFLDKDLANLPPNNPKMRFRANRSLRDVEPAVTLIACDLSGTELSEEEQ